MKTKLVLSALLVAFSMQAYSQDVTIIQSNETDNTQSYSSSSTKKPKFWIGPKFGMDNIGIPASMTEVKDQLESNWQAGVMMQFGRILYLQPEVYYASRSYSLGTTTTTSNAVKIPAMLGLRFINLGLFSLHVMGGPSFTLKLDDKDGFTGEKSMDWLVGAGIDVLGFITADVRYKYDTDVAFADQVNEFSFKKTPLNLTVGLKFR
jgi:hypothetical protein